jgi:alkylation response protein AidB-like acyl-CoA dehydrogenase
MWRSSCGRKGLGSFDARTGTSSPTYEDAVVQAGFAELLSAARALAPEIRRERDAIERDRRLPAALVERLRTAQLLELWLPRAFGGPELHPIEFMQVIEAIAQADGSVGWCAAVGGTLSQLAGSLREDAAQHIFSGDTVVAGSFKAGGNAVAVAGGFRITGRWDFGSGIHHSTWLAVNCIGDDGTRFAFVPTREATILDTWHVSGLRGTGSHDYTLTDVFVPAERTAPSFVVAPVQPGGLYRIPLLSLASSSLAAVSLGVARGAITALIELAARKTPTGSSTALCDRPTAQAAVGRAEALVRAGRAGLFDAMQQQWDEVAGGGTTSSATRALMRLSSAYCAEACTAAVDLVYRTAGASASFENGLIARGFRDVHAAGQHIGLSVDNYEHAGRVLFGRDPGPRY